MSSQSDQSGSDSSGENGGNPGSSSPGANMAVATSNAGPDWTIVANTVFTSAWQAAEVMFNIWSNYDRPVQADPTLTRGDAPALWNELDAMGAQIVDGAEVKAVTMIVMGGAAISVGYVAWTVRAGYVLAAILTSAPVWKELDPLAVLEASDSRRKRRGEDSLLGILKSGRRPGTVS